MSETPTHPIGTVGWYDLTVPDADGVRDFYASVVGWTAQPLSMGDYSDYVMLAPGGTAVGGVCHARGANATIPAAWLVYITVADLDASLAACAAGGGSVIVAAKPAGGGARYAVIRDPAGAACALYQNAPTPA